MSMIGKYHGRETHLKRHKVLHNKARTQHKHWKVHENESTTTEPADSNVSHLGEGAIYFSSIKSSP